MVKLTAAAALATLAFASSLAAAQQQQPQGGSSSPSSSSSSSSTTRLSAASGKGRCTAPVVRREFRELTDAQKQSFIDANLCLRDRTRSPSVLGKDIGSPTLYDDLVYVHSTGAPRSHNAAAFLPWHRQFLGIYEYWLNKQCGYTGGIPYWDWSIDSQAPERSPILSDKWFGGNGRGNDNCIANGQLRNMKTHFPVTQRATCIARRFNSDDQGGNRDRLPPFPSYAQVMEILELGDDYNEFRRRVEGNPHALVHDAIGGHMGSVRYSANDVLFWLHHANIDRMYAVWQAEHPDLALQFDGLEADRTPGGDEASSSDRLRFFGIYPDKTVQSVLSHSSGDLLCYTYTNSLLHNSASAASESGRASLKARGFLDHQGFAAWRQSRVAGANGAAEPAPSPPAGGAATTKPGGTTAGGAAGSPHDPTTPAPFDRENLYNLRHTPPVSDEHFLSIGYTAPQIAAARADEQLYRDFIDYVNSASGYISKNALLYVESATGYHAPSDEEYALRKTLTQMLCHAANLVLVKVKKNKDLAEIFGGVLKTVQSSVNAAKEGGGGDDAAAGASGRSAAASFAMLARPVASFQQAYKRMLA
ncbi:hypothetical protein HDU86_007816 [Geranomyces michiganensis]|nr:hypothetical protein HDU86_007816 [Geranomyces michiganensis]